MTLNEILKKQGVSDELIEKILSDMKQNKVYTSSEENIDIRYGKLKTDFEQLKKSSKGNEELQTKIATYESQIADLQRELTDTKIKSALKFALFNANVVDTDYLSFKLENQLKQENKALELDDNGNIKDIKKLLLNLKTQFPTQFITDSQKKIEENKLPIGNSGNDVTAEQFNKMGYQERLKLYNDSPELYKELTKKE